MPTEPQKPKENFGTISVAGQPPETYGGWDREKRQPILYPVGKGPTTLSLPK